MPALSFIFDDILIKESDCTTGERLGSFAAFLIVLDTRLQNSPLVGAS
jgi:hypothetical protein